MYSSTYILGLALDGTVTVLTVLLLLLLAAEANVRRVLLKNSSVVNVVTVNTKNSVRVPTFGSSMNHSSGTHSARPLKRAGPPPTAPPGGRGQLFNQQNRGVCFGA